MFAAYAARIDPDQPLTGLELGDRPAPEARPGWSTVTVRAASLNHHDLWSLRGVGLSQDRLPMILGCDAAGLDEELPFRYLRPMELGGGTGIWSRHPLSEETEHLGFVLNMVSARVQPPTGPSFVLVAAHPLPPVPRPQTDIWSRELGQVRGILRDLRAGGATVVVGADFNATFDHAQYRALIDDGFGEE